MGDQPNPTAVPRYERRFFDPDAPITAIGDGAPGGKARGLLFARQLIAERFPSSRYPDLLVEVPSLTVLQTGAFERFMSANALWPLAHSGASDARIALAFQAAELPAEIVGDLRSLVSDVHTPLAVRSSSLLEDAQTHPFAGVYVTKMLPNDQLDADARFRKLAAAIKLVYASTFFQTARAYLLAAGLSPADERMAVVIQEVIGRRHGTRFYPDVSGVARSYSFYRSGRALPEDGFAALALGLGKTIVDGGLVWSYSPAHPRATPPFSTVADLLHQTQTECWAVSMDGKPRYDPVAEVEYLVKVGLADAEEDGTLALTASSYDAASDRLYPGVRGHGARALTFAPLLQSDQVPLNAVVRQLLTDCQTALGAPVEIEFALTVDEQRDPRARLGFLQVRPMSVSSAPVTPDARPDQRIIVSSETALGNGVREDIRDVVFVRPDTFDRARTRSIAAELGAHNRRLVGEGRPYLLVGFGRWGSSDPWLGVPVEWSSIGGARAIVEAATDTFQAEPSQGSHFFHNLASFGVLYFTVRPEIDPDIDWTWLNAQPAAADTPMVRHVRLASPLVIKVDGRTGRGVILTTDTGPA